jgi:hypothetical protein
VQSGVGSLTIEAACSPAVGDLRLGCAYELTSGLTSLVQPDGGPTTAPPTGRRPVLAASHEQFETLRIDLRRSRELRRLVVLAYSGSGAELSWGGTLIVRTFGGTRVEVPLARDPASGVLVALSLYAVDGEYVLRAEDELVPGGLREACTAYGFDAITWLDDRTPLT